MSAQKKYFQQGVAPLFIILLICFGFVGLFLIWNITGFKFNIGKPPVNNVPQKQNQPQVTLPKSTPTAQPQQLSLKQLCLSEMKSLPKPPFRYQSQSEPVGTLLPTYRKERFNGAKKTYSCYTNFMFNRVMEQAYADMGVQYYERDKYGNEYIKAGAIQAFEKAVDSALAASFQKDGWERKTQYGEKSNLVVVMSLAKTKGDREYFLDIAYPGASGVAFSYTLTVMEK